MHLAAPTAAPAEDPTDVTADVEAVVVEADAVDDVDESICRVVVMLVIDSCAGDSLR